MSEGQKKKKSSFMDFYDEKGVREELKKYASNKPVLVYNNTPYDVR